MLVSELIELAAQFEQTYGVRPTKVYLHTADVDELYADARRTGRVWAEPGSLMCVDGVVIHDVRGRADLEHLGRATSRHTVLYGDQRDSRMMADTCRTVAHVNLPGCHAFEVVVPHFRGAPASRVVEAVAAHVVERIPDWHDRITRAAVSQKMRAVESSSMYWTVYGRPDYQRWFCGSDIYHQVTRSADRWFGGFSGTGATPAETPPLTMEETYRAATTRLSRQDLRRASQPAVPPSSQQRPASPVPPLLSSLIERSGRGGSAR